MDSKNQMEIRWNTLTLQEWSARFNHLCCSNILQSYHYAQALAASEKQKARWGLILIGEQEAGLVQVIEASALFNLFHGVIIDRGPLWFEGFGGAAHIKLFFDEIEKQFPNRFGRKRRFIPEVQNGAAAEGILKQCGLQKNNDQKPYQTLWWDLTIDSDSANDNLRSNWRGSLNKAERAGLNIEWDDKGTFYPWLRDKYKKDKQLRGFGGVSPRFLDNLARFSTQENPMIIGKVTKDGQNIAGVMFLKHGRSATYQIGWSSEEGRKYCAHHLLLWQGRSILAERGVNELDLGGINDEAEGLKKFKEGTGASPSRLVGHYS